MQKFVMKLLCAGLVVLGIQTLPLLTRTSIAQEPAIEPAAGGTAADLVLPVVSPRAGVRYTTDGPGFDSFASFEGFIPLLQTPGSNLTFLDTRLLLGTPNSALGANVTVGYRSFNLTSEQIIGGYFSYDYRNTGLTAFNQLGGGFEFFSNPFDARFNAYIPIGENKRSIVGTSLTGTGTFQPGGLLALDRQISIQEALPGFDAEVGTLLTRIGDGSLRGYVGLYYYDGQGSPGFVGFKTRLLARPNDSITAGLALQTDSRFDTRLTFSVGLNFPGSNPAGITDQTALLSRIADSVERQSNITVENQTERDTLIATSGGTNIRFVDIQGGSLNTIAEALAVAQTNETIYVGGDTTANTNVNLNVARLNGVKLIGLSSATNITTDQGLVTSLVPVVPGSPPAISGTVTLGNNNTIDTFVINAPGARAISATGVSNPVIQNNTITAALGEGIYLENVTGTAQIINNSVSNVTRRTVAPDLNGAIFARNNTGTIDLLIERNRVTVAASQDVDGIEADFCPAGSAPFPCTSPVNGTVRILNNTITSGGDDGIDVDLGSNARVSFTITGNTAQNLVDKGFAYESGGTSQVPELTVTNNRFTNFGDKGPRIRLLDSSTITTLNISDNTITNPTPPGTPRGEDGITVDMQNTAVIQSATIARNTISNIGSNLASHHGIQIDLANTAEIRQLIVESNPISGVAGDGIRITNTSTVRNSPTIRNNTITSPGANGIVATNTNNASVTGNTIANAATDGVNLTNAIGTVAINNNTIGVSKVGFPGDDGIEVRNTAGTINLTVSGNRIAGLAAPDAGDNGVELNLTGTAAGTVQITNNPSISNVREGVFLNIDGTSPTITVSGNTISNVAFDGVLATINGNAAPAITVSNNTISEIGAFGNGINVLTDSTSTTPTTVVISGNRVTGATAPTAPANNRGIDVQAFGISQTRLTIDNNTVTRNGFEGVAINAENTAQISTTVRLNTMTANGADGFNATNNGTSTLCLQLANNTNTGSNYTITNGGGGTLQFQNGGGNTGTIVPTGTTAAPPFVGCTVP